MRLFLRRLSSLLRGHEPASGGSESGAGSSDDPFDSFVQSLGELDDPRAAILPPWKRHLRMFGVLMDGVARDGLVVTLSNNWIVRAHLQAALERIQVGAIADRLADATALALKRGSADERQMFYDRVVSDDRMFEIFESVERELEDRWEALWDAARTYATVNGWDAEAGATD